MTTQAVFFGLLFPGILALLAGVMLTRLHWRPDIPAYGRETSFLDVTTHPEKYVKDAPLRAIRILNTMGALLQAGALVVVLYEISRTTLRAGR